MRDEDIEQAVPSDGVFVEEPDAAVGDVERDLLASGGDVEGLGPEGR